MQNTAVFTDSEFIRTTYPVNTPENSSKPLENTRLIDQDTAKTILESLGWKKPLIDQYLAVASAIEPFAHLTVTDEIPDLDEPYTQGRGFHYELDKDILIDPDITIPKAYYIYVKGQGIRQSKKESHHMNPKLPYPQDLNFFESSLPMQGVHRRILGASYSGTITAEWVTNMIVLTDYIQAYNIKTFQEILEANLPVALPPIRHDHLSQYYTEQIPNTKVTTEESRTISKYGIGSIVYLTPDHIRYEQAKNIYHPESLYLNTDKFVEATDKLLLLAKLGFCYEPNSAHFKQVLFHMKENGLPFMDFADVIPLEMIFDTTERYRYLAASLVRFLKSAIEQKQTVMQENMQAEDQVFLQNLATIIHNNNCWKDLSNSDIQGIFLFLPAELFLLLLAKEVVSKTPEREPRPEKIPFLGYFYTDYLLDILDNNHSTYLIGITHTDILLQTTQRELLHSTVILWRKIQESRDILLTPMLLSFIADELSIGHLVTESDLRHLQNVS